MQRVDDADAVAFEVVFDRYSGAAFSLAYRMCGRQSIAEDIVQDTFLSLWRRGGRFDRARGSVRSWVLGAVRNRAIDSFRHETAKTGRDVSDDAAAGGSPRVSEPIMKSNGETRQGTCEARSSSFRPSNVG